MFFSSRRNVRVEQGKGEFQPSRIEGDALHIVGKKSEQVTGKKGELLSRPGNERGGQIYDGAFINQKRAFPAGKDYKSGWEKKKTPLLRRSTGKGKCQEDSGRRERP